jgi:ADP-ribose pyrophosphatase YjhB (NUDIX family)
MYGNRVRVRSCGICVENDSILLVNHRGLRAGNFWAPPGGGVEWGETAAGAVAREFREETRLDVTVGNFLFACEYIQTPLHAIELFFEVKRTGGTLGIGTDPENPAFAVIDSVRWIPFRELAKWPPEEIHGVFRFCSIPAQIIGLRGYFTLGGVV